MSMYFLQKRHYINIRLGQWIMLLIINVEQKHSNHFFPWTITKLNSLGLQIWNSSYKAFKKHFIHDIRPVPNSVFNVHNPIGIGLLTRLRLGLSHLNKHRFNEHKFQNCTNLNCIFSSEN